MALVFVAVVQETVVLEAAVLEAPGIEESQLEFPLGRRAIAEVMPGGQQSAESTVALTNEEE